jgi:flagellar hook-associated protein 2
VVTAGQDAEITIGTDVLHSSTNTFSDVANGLTISLGSTVTSGTVVNLDAQQDTAGMTAKVKGIVDAINDALSKIDSLTAYDASTNTSGPLAGDSGVRAVRSDLLNTVYPTDGTSLASVGIQLDKFGKLTFDEAAFKTAYAADPAGVAAKFTTGATDGFAARVQAAGKRASDPFTGTITTSITVRNSEIKQMQDSIADWDTRLALRQESLQRQFTALETALSQMNSQSSWLSGQLSSLKSGS